MEVCGLSDWKGIKSKIDIAKTNIFKKEGKIHSLKNLTMKYLGKNIQ